MNTTRDLLLHGWEVHPSVVVGCVAMLGWYFSDSRRIAKHSVCFCAGVLLLCLSLISPLDPLGDEYLFSAHMVQHLFLILIVPPLLIVGLVPQRVTSWMRGRRFPALGTSAESACTDVVFEHGDDGCLAYPSPIQRRECKHGGSHSGASDIPRDGMHVSGGPSSHRSKRSGCSREGPCCTCSVQL